MTLDKDKENQNKYLSYPKSPVLDLKCLDINVVEWPNNPKLSVSPSIVSLSFKIDRSQTHLVTPFFKKGLLEIIVNILDIYSDRYFSRILISTIMAIV